jgi:peptidyl-prolyl cis-trans isomerase C
MLTKSKSIDHETKDNGGSLGWFRKNDMVVPIFNQVIKMSKGEVTKTPIQTKFGWHIIKLIDIKNANPPSFEEVKEELKTGLQKAKLKKYLDDLRAEAKIKIN